MKYMIAALLIVAGCSGQQDPRGGIKNKEASSVRKYKSWDDSLFPVELGRYWKYAFNFSIHDGICGNGSTYVSKVVEYIVVAENRLKVIEVVVVKDRMSVNEGKKVVREISFDPRNVGLSIPLQFRVMFGSSDPDFFPPARPEEGAREVIEVPAGRFDAVAFSMPGISGDVEEVNHDDSIGDLKASTIRWFAPGVGLVRQTHKSYSQSEHGAKGVIGASSYASWELLSTGVYDRK